MGGVQREFVQSYIDSSRTYSAVLVAGQETSANLTELNRRTLEEPTRGWGKHYIESSGRISNHRFNAWKREIEQALTANRDGLVDSSLIEKCMQAVESCRDYLTKQR